MNRIIQGSICGILLGVTCLSAAPTMAQAPDESVAYVKVAPSAKGTSYCVGGAECVVGGGVMPYQGVMNKLATALKNGGKGQLLAIIISPEVGIGTVELLSEVAQKVGFERVRIFVENEKHTRVREITLSKTLAAPSAGQVTFRLEDGK